MALTQSRRLKYKDIWFLVRRRKYFPSKFFGFFYFEQYRNLQYNQISCHIPLKFCKKAVYRNVLKRLIIDEVRKNNFVEQKFMDEKYYKVYISLNKKNLEILKEKFDTLSSLEFSKFFRTEFTNTFKFFVRKISWTSSQK